MRVLVVEDNDLVRELLGSALGLYDIEVDIVTARFERLDRPALAGYDAVICDQDLGCSVTGCDILRIVEEAHPSTRRVLLSAFVDARGRAVDGSVPDDCPAQVRLGKPVDVDTLLEALR